MKILKPLYKLKPYILTYKKSFILGLSLVVISNVLYSILPKVLQLAIDKIQAGVSQRQLLCFALLVVVITVLYSGIRFWMRLILFGVARKIENQMRNDFVRHLQKLSLRFFIKNSTGDLMARATNDIPSVAMTIGRGLMFFFSNVIVFVVVIVMMIVTDAKLTLLALIPFPLVFVVVYWSMGFFFRTFEKIQNLFGDISTRAQENFAGVRVVKAYVQEDHEIETFDKLNRNYLSENLRLAMGRGLMGASMEILFGTAYLILLWIGGNQVIGDRISIGDFVAFTVWIGMLAWPIISFGWIINLVQRASASMVRINKIMNWDPEIQDCEECDNMIETISGNIEFRDVSFSYDGQPVLKNINFKIKSGTTLALVGPTGSGKTSFINLIPRLYDCPSGTVLIDGRDVRSIPLKVLRREIGYVPQETFLFSESIAENISFGVEDPLKEDIDWAAEISTIKEDLLSFPDQYQTLIGERGVNLSGGQKQRTAISRALLRKPKILILDDALSSVDTYTEEKILQRLQKNYFDQTNIIISHRISSVKHADLILVLQNGKIIERGNHKSLLKEQGFYAELYKQQLLETALEEM